LWCPIYGCRLKSSQPERQQGSLVTKRLRSLVTSDPRKDAVLQTWSIPLESVLSKTRCLRQNVRAGSTLSMREAKPISPQWCPVSPCSSPIYLVLSSAPLTSPKGNPAHNPYIHSRILPLLHAATEERGTNGTVKLALLRPPDERQKLRFLLGS